VAHFSSSAILIAIMTIQKTLGLQIYQKQSNIYSYGLFFNDELGILMKQI